MPELPCPSCNGTGRKFLRRKGAWQERPCSRCDGAGQIDYDSTRVMATLSNGMIITQDGKLRVGSSRARKRAKR